MLKNILVGAVLAVLVLGAWSRWAQAADQADRKLAHDVYFTLKDNSDAAKAKLVAACKKYLNDHPGTLWFGVGTRGKEFNRPVNDQEYDVSLHVGFQNKDAHDKYQKAERHLKFIEENKETWKKVRVFDSYLE
jgi:hypothetical protein